ncbi:TonB-dependent receptor plug domain-containing protein [Planctomycetota bacterium]
MIRALTALIAVCLSCMPVLCADGEPATNGVADLGDMVVTATRSKRLVFDVANTVDVLSREDMQMRQVRTVPESLGEVPGVMVQKTGHGQGSPFIRGFTGFRTLFLIDGIRLNNSIFRDGPNQYWNTVDSFTIESMEIVKGPGSVLYGSDAVGGTVNAITLRPNIQEEGSWWGRRLYSRYAGAEESLVGRIELDGSVNGRFGFVAGGSFKNFGDLHGGRDVGLQRNTGYDETDGDLKLVFRLRPNSTLTFAHQFVDQDDAWRTHKTTSGISWEGTTVGNEKKRILDQHRDLTYLRYEQDRIGRFVDSLQVTVSYHRQEEERYRLRSDDRSDVQGVDVGTLGVTLQLETPSSLGTWTYGVDYYRDTVDSFRNSWNADGTFRGASIQGPVGGDASYGTLDLYTQLEGRATERLDAVIGLRYTSSRLDAGKVEDPETGNRISLSDDWDTVVGSVRGLYRVDPDDEWHVFGGVSQGFRAPNLSDMTRLDTARTGEIETPTTNLDPERFLATEIGVRARKQKWSGSLAYFYTLIDDMIIRTPTGDTVDGDAEVTKKNSGDGYVEGVELGVEYAFLPDLVGTVAGTMMYGRVDTYPTATAEKKDEPIDRIMPATVHLGLRWNHPSGKYWVQQVCTLAEEANSLSTRDKSDTQRIPPGGTPAYTVVTIRGGWRVLPTLSVTGAIENITDEDHRIHGSGQNEPGRNLILGFDWRF